MKFHYMLELMLVSRYTNPLYGSCYSGEEMMGVVRKLVASCANGARPEVAANTALKKYTRGLAFMLKAQQDKLVE